MNKLLIFLIFISVPLIVSAQGFLHADGKYIYNGTGEEIILRGIGTGNWMIQEGYMMKTSDVASAQHEIQAKILATIGETKTDSFYTSWLQNHMTRNDIDSMKAWGFNSIRVAMHYIWFTPPIEDEPVGGQITWLQTGFDLIDSLLAWCSANQMYLILDMHGAPGGQGKDAAISDYDASKPSLWESQENKNKLIALWYKLATRYKDEPWIGGYDLINEPNWDFENSGNQNGCNCNSNTPLRSMYEVLIDTIRTIDQNHLIVVEGNCWGNRYNGMTSIASYDNNLVISFHKYWNYNNTNAIQGFLDMRNSLDVPVWLGESGENSNTWFTNAIQLCENNRIGWSWWPVKKNGINNILMSEANNDYLDLIEYWKGNTSKPAVDKAFQALLTWSDNQRFENCIIQHDVIDAMIRQPHSFSPKPFKANTVATTIYAVDYDLGRNNVAYSDNDTANYHVTEGEYTNWNQGWSYRNDGVDIEACTDTETNGYNVGWTEDGEWLSYTIYADTTAAYTLNIRYASNTNGTLVRLEIDGVPAIDKITFNSTGGWQNWQTIQVNNFIFPAGTHQLKFIFEKGGINLNYLRLTNPISSAMVDFKAIDALTTDGDTILLALNKEITSDISSIKGSDFSISTNNHSLVIAGFKLCEKNQRVLKIGLSGPIFYGEVATVSYTGSSIQHADQNLGTFTGLPVRVQLPMRFTIPGKIQAEDFYVNNGFVMETCTDNGGGQNTAYAEAGDYLDYLVYVPSGGWYTINYRVATTASDAKLMVQTDNIGSFITIDTIAFNATGGWQVWQTQSSSVNLPEGRYTLRLKILSGEQNLNWFEVTGLTGAKVVSGSPVLKLYPNPASTILTVSVTQKGFTDYSIRLLDISGRQLMKIPLSKTGTIDLSVEHLANGMYFLEIYNASVPLSVERFIKN